MDDETNLDVQDTPEVEALPEVESDNTQEVEIELDENGDPVEGEPEAVEEEETTEVVKDGKAYKVPAALKDELLMHADYTRKTQEVAELRKQVSATLEQVQQVTQAELSTFADIAKLEGDLSRFANIDWRTWSQTDPIEAQAAFIEYTQTKEERDAALAKYQQAQQQRTFVQQQETARLIEQGQRELATKIPGWGQEKAQALQTHAASAYGFKPEELKGIVDPRMIEVLHDAYQFRQASKTQQVVRKVEAQQAIKPAAKVATGKTPPRGLDDRLSTEEWAKQFTARRARR